MDTNDMIAGYVGTTQVTRLYLGSELVWPSNFTYTIISATIHYSSGSTLNAGVVGSAYSGNYAYITGTVRLSRGQVIISETTEYLVPTVSNTSDFNVIYDSTLGYYTVRGNNLGRTETSAIKSTSVTVTYSSSAAYSVSSSITQERNIKTEGTPTTERQYGSPSSTTTSDGYYVYFGINSYTSSSNPCPASGGSATWWASAGHTDTTVTTTPWYDITTPHYNYTSGATSDGTPYMSDQGTSTTTSTQPVTDTASISGGTSAIYISGNNIVFDSEGATVYSSGRSATFTASNNTATPVAVTVYQEANVVVSSAVVPSLSLFVDYSGTLYPAQGGLFNVSYASFGNVTATYTSGSTSTSAQQAITSKLTGTNCTPKDNQGNTITTVSGGGTFKIQIPAATGNVERWVIITMKEQESGNEETARVSKQQSRKNIASFLPYVSPGDVSGVFDKGKVYFYFNVSQGSLLSTTLGGVVFHYQLTNQSEATISIGDMAVTSSSSAYLLQNYTGASIPIFQTGNTGEAWFTVSSQGDVQTLDCPHFSINM